METVIDYPLGELLLRLRRWRGNHLVGWLGRRYVYLLGPEANRFVFAHDELFRVHEAFELLIPVDGPTSLVVSDGDDHRRRRALVRPGLHRNQVNGYIDTMASTADAALAPFAAGDVVDGYALFRRAIRRSTLQSLFGDDFADRTDEIGERLQPLLDLVDRLPQIMALEKRFHTRRWRRAMAAREDLDDFVYAEIKRARTGRETSAVLSTLVHGRDDGGGGLSDLEVRDQVVTMIAAGYETTSGVMGWALHALGSRPELQRRLRAEVSDVTGGEIPTPDQLAELPLLTAVINETMRIYPPGVIVPRYVAQEFEFEGRTIRPGTMIIISPYVTHRSPEIYDEPRAFRPERWLAGKRPTAEFLPFGGGAHRCIGATMAMTELTVMLARLLSRWQFSLEPNRTRAVGMAALRPQGGVPIRLSAWD